MTIKFREIIYVLIIGTAISMLLSYIVNDTKVPPSITHFILKPTITPTPTPAISLMTPLTQKILTGGTHAFQTFNNCGPASLSMMLAYYGITVDQHVLGQALRPYQNTRGDNDDKSVIIPELAEKAKEYGLLPYHRHNGTFEAIKLFITYDMPVMARTLTKPNEDIGHYRIIKGYDDALGVLIQDDSLQGKNLSFTYEAFNNLWQAFGYEFLVLVPPGKRDIAEAILGDEKDERTSWIRAADRFRDRLRENPDDVFARFNLSIALYHIGDFQASVSEFVTVEHRLPFRTLWYQIEPILSYYELGEYQRVFALTDKILMNDNRAFSELYMLRGQIYERAGDIDVARQEYMQAVLYHRNLTTAHDALTRVSPD